MKLSWEQINLVLQPHKEQILELQVDLCCCVSHRRIRARRWPAGSRRPLPAALRGPASWHYLVACSWCWRRWTRSTCPASAEATSSRTETREQTIFSFRSRRNAEGTLCQRPPAPPHLADDAVLHVGLLVASLLAHQSDLQLTERLRQDVTLCEELPPLHNVGLQQRCVILVTQHPLGKSEKPINCRTRTDDDGDNQNVTAGNQQSYCADVKLSLRLL